MNVFSLTQPKRSVFVLRHFSMPPSMHNFSRFLSVIQESFLIKISLSCLLLSYQHSAHQLIYLFTVNDSKNCCWWLIYSLRECFFTDSAKTVCFDVKTFFHISLKHNFSRFLSVIQEFFNKNKFINLSILKFIYDKKKSKIPRAQIWP